MKVSIMNNSYWYLTEKDTWVANIEEALTFDTAEAAYSYGEDHTNCDFNLEDYEYHIKVKNIRWFNKLKKLTWTTTENMDEVLNCYTVYDSHHIKIEYNSLYLDNCRVVGMEKVIDMIRDHLKDINNKTSFCNLIDTI